ncbi:OmpA family protein [Hyphococcus sp.]|uniref:OmpA family protein n=1 Tax=Hyphococcus sp. TaxID=2038636 RepID=UPI003CCC34AD
MRIKTTLLTAAAVMAISPAAQAYDGLYGAIGAGLSYLDGDTDINNNSGGSGTPQFDSTQEHDLGIGVYAAIGYAYENNLRAELEFSYRNNDIDSIDPDGGGFSGWPTGTISGDTTSMAIMGNVLYDFGDGPVTPYIGLGTGIANVDHDITGTNPGGFPVQNITYGSSNWQWAYQGIAGLSFALAEGLNLDLSYRYFRTRKKNLAGTLGGGPAAFEVGHDPHSLFAGLRWDFVPDRAAPVAPQFKDCWDGSSVPVTAECPPQMVDNTDIDLDPIQFTVYFDYDKSNLTSQASDLVREAASRALANDIDNVVVAGNTDTSGSSAYNQALSERRARVVRDALIANGVSADRIRLEAYGENNLAKPTADGVREPLNRRSDVTISFE